MAQGAIYRLASARQPVRQKGEAMQQMSRRSMLVGSGAALAALRLPGGAAASPPAAKGRPRGRGRGPGGLPIVIGHRGSPAYRPEHTIESYTLAIEMGADYIEPDLVFTKDGQLVARHEPDIGATTNVADHPEFAGRRKTVTIDGTVFPDTWFTFDFTLAELRTLRAKERLPLVRPQNTAFDGLFEIPIFQEVIDLAKANGVGIYPETKHPTFFGSLGFSFDAPLLGTLRRNGLDHPGAKVFIQSFEVGNLKRLRSQTPLPLIQLIDVTGAPADLAAQGDPRTYDDLVTPRGLAEIATYADGIGPDKSRIVAGNTAGNPLGSPTTLVRDAHRVGLLLHPFTFRPENNFLASDFRVGNPSSPEFLHARGDQPAELALYYRLGVDGLFADNPDTAVAVREKTFGRTRTAA
ncbi:MAG: glycerophosphoryl diester phosphodiesterase [Conexibacter sp.]|nr:glycerophosphoryl diester phosphodiesterase [Conexibacter sp.]